MRGGLNDLSVSRSKVQVGDPVSGTPRPRRLRLARRARQLHHRARIRLGGRRASTASSGTTRRPSASTSSARTSCASTPSTGRRSCCRPGCPLPTTVWAHGWWLRDAKKVSKSVGNVVRPDQLVADFGPDALRYFLLREMAFGQDASFSDEAFLDALQRRPRQRPRQHGLARRGALPAVLRRRRRARSAPTTRSCAPSTRRAAEWRAAMQECQFNRALEAVWRFLDRGQRLRRRAGALEDPQGRRRRLGAPPSRALRGRRGRAPLGRHALAVRPRDLAAGSSRPSRSPPTDPDLRRPRLGPAARLAPMPEAPALFPRADAAAYFKEKDDDHDRTDVPPRRRRAAARPTTASRSRTSRRCVCARRRSSPPSACPSRTS